MSTGIVGLVVFTLQVLDSSRPRLSAKCKDTAGQVWPSGQSLTPIGFKDSILFVFFALFTHSSELELIKAQQ